MINNEMVKTIELLEKVSKADTDILFWSGDFKKKGNEIVLIIRISNMLNDFIKSYETQWNSFKYHSIPLSNFKSEILNLLLEEKNKLISYIKSVKEEQREIEYKYEQIKKAYKENKNIFDLVKSLVENKIIVHFNLSSYDCYESYIEVEREQSIRINIKEIEEYTIKNISKMSNKTLSKHKKRVENKEKHLKKLNKLIKKVENIDD